MRALDSPPATRATRVPEGITDAVSRLDRACALVREGRVTAGLQELHALAGDMGALAELGDAGHAVLLSSLVDCRLARGDLVEATSLRDAMSAYAGQEGLSSALARYTNGELAATLGDPELAARHFLAAGEHLGDLPVAPELLPWRVGAALAMVRSGNRSGAELARVHHGEAVRSGSAYAVALALRTLATSDACGQRIALLREARGTLAGVAAARLAAQIDTDLASMLVLSNDPRHRSEALRLLRAAEVYCGREELWPLQGRVRRVLDQLGEPAEHSQSEALATLTRVERRVGALAADGLTNQQIADHLVVSRKAVEGRLSQDYRKLGIASRGALAPLLGPPA